MADLPPAWSDRAAYMRVIGRLQRELSRELDLAQPGSRPGEVLPALLEQVRAARSDYARACALAQIVPTEGTIGA